MLRKVERCTIWACDHEADGPCHQCGRLLCEVHAFPHEKQRYCYTCHQKRIEQQMQSRALRDW